MEDLASSTIAGFASTISLRLSYISATQRSLTFEVDSSIPLRLASETPSIPHVL